MSSEQELRAEIAQTRAELGRTVEALAAKADVKTRAKEAARRQVAVLRGKASEAARRQVAVLRGKASEAGRSPAVRRSIAPAVAVVSLATGIVLVVRGRRR